MDCRQIVGPGHDGVNLTQHDWRWLHAPRGDSRKQSCIAHGRPYGRSA
ncbi:hypothetical protein [Lysobacter gummosus]